MADGSDDCAKMCSWAAVGYLIGSFQIGHHHLDLIGPEKDIYYSSRMERRL